MSLSLGGQHSLTLVRASDSEDRDTGAVASASDDAFEPYQLYSWGMGDYGCLGLCHLSSSNVPAGEYSSKTAGKDLCYGPAVPFE